jgi:SnoaL-like domain
LRRPAISSAKGSKTGALLHAPAQDLDTRQTHSLSKLSRQEEMMTISSSDKRDIEEALCRLYDTLDGNHNAEGFAASFTPDGVVSSRYGEYKGRVAITDWLRDHIAKGAEDGARHMLSNFLVDEINGGAEIRCYLLKVVADDFRIWLAGTSWITAQVVQKDGKWLFTGFSLKHALQKPQGPLN